MLTWPSFATGSEGWKGPQSIPSSRGFKGLSGKWRNSPGCRRAGAEHPQRVKEEISVSPLSCCPRLSFLLFFCQGACEVLLQSQKRARCISHVGKFSRVCLLPVLLRFLFCMNTTYCSKVAFPLEVVQKDPGFCVSRAIKPMEEMFYLEHAHEVIPCPDIDGFYPPSAKPTIKWYKNCVFVKDFYDIYPHGPNLTFGIIRDTFKGDYTCIVTFQENGRAYNLTRTVRMKVVGSPNKALPPQFTSPNEKVVYKLEPGEDLVLPCQVYFTFLKDSRTEVWWTIDGKNTDDITDPRVKVTQSETAQLFGDKDIVRMLTIAKVTPEDLKRNYTCHARNSKGVVQQQALVKMKVAAPRYTVELACGLGATILLVVVLIVIYHVYWLEMVLFYRAHFGTDETILDGKEYDVYVSYARNAEEEEFVLLTLRGVLENEFGYKLCIFDRDSLPGGKPLPSQPP
uniref:Interleukin 1 receptor accessory protein n=1 Tax=Crocodylus porosus TaxID=8502 RepID=A0A7M4F3Y7_CROPO